jgi:hypothetical protein
MASADFAKGSAVFLNSTSKTCSFEGVGVPKKRSNHA